MLGWVLFNIKIRAAMLHYPARFFSVRGAGGVFASR
jgi:hypothetical protein